jgi:hypothetical protein
MYRAWNASWVMTDTRDPPNLRAALDELWPLVCVASLHMYCLGVCPLESEQRQRLVEFVIGVIDGGVFDDLDVGTNSGVADAFVDRPHVQSVAVA